MAKLSANIYKSPVDIIPLVLWCHVVNHYVSYTELEVEWTTAFTSSQPSCRKHVVPTCFFLTLPTQFALKRLQLLFQQWSFSPSIQQFVQ